MIKLHKIPNQQFTFNLDNSLYAVTLQSRGGKTYLSYKIGKENRLLNRLCLDRVPIDDLFIFEDSQGKEDPYYDGFGGRFKLRLL